MPRKRAQEKNEIPTQLSTSNGALLEKSIHSVPAYTLEQLKEVYYLGMINGATIWQLCQDNTKNPLSSFEQVTNELRKAVTSEQSIKDLASSQGMLLGVSAEILGLESIV